MKEQTNNPVPNFFLASAENFKKIPGSPIAYWVSDKIRKVFERFPSMTEVVEAKQGLATADNNRFLRLWWENNTNNINLSARNRGDSLKSRCRWFPYNKGAQFRKWFGNQEYMINWENDGNELDNFRPRSVIRNPDYYFRESISWSDVTSSTNSFRFYPHGFIFDSTGHSAFPHNCTKEQLLSFCNNKFTNNIIKILNPTMHFHVGYFNSLPAAFIDNDMATNIVNKSILHSKSDWDSYETSWDFTELPLLSGQWVVGNEQKESSTTTYNYPVHNTLSEVYSRLKLHWHETTQEMQRLEEKNNRIFIEAYGLQDELTPDVPLNEITLTCNPHYRYNGNKSENELEALLLADTIKEFISYAVGCMFGRYSLDKPGLILANQDETIEDYKNQIPDPTFEPDDDNVIPILDGDWFIDDIADRFRTFLRITFGEEHYNENLKFLEQAIGKDIRKYFLKDFYNHHVKTYKKRPIYWMFSSPKGSFNALIYMHRYRPDTVSIVLNNYLREFRKKIAAKKENLEEISSSSSSSQRDKTKSLKEIEKLKKVITELEDYERDVLYPLATKQVEIDLDDGVKINYNKFGKALRKVAELTD
jgi:hypothetical protein